MRALAWESDRLVSSTGLLETLTEAVGHVRTRYADETLTDDMVAELLLTYLLARLAAGDGPPAGRA